MTKRTAKPRDVEQSPREKLVAAAVELLAARGYGGAQVRIWKRELRHVLTAVLSPATRADQ